MWTKDDLSLLLSLYFYDQHHDVTAYSQTASDDFKNKSHIKKQPLSLGRAYVYSIRDGSNFSAIITGTGTPALTADSGFLLCHLGPFEFPLPCLLCTSHMPSQSHNAFQTQAPRTVRGPTLTDRRKRNGAFTPFTLAIQRPPFPSSLLTFVIKGTAERLLEEILSFYLF